MCTKLFDAAPLCCRQQPRNNPDYESRGEEDGIVYAMCYVTWLLIRSLWNMTKNETLPNKARNQKTIFYCLTYMVGTPFLSPYYTVYIVTRPLAKHINIYISTIYKIHLRWSRWSCFLEVTNRIGIITVLSPQLIMLRMIPRHCILS